MAEIDLSHFCYTEDDRSYLKQPWSRGDFTYATNGHIMVRVPRRSDVPENDKAPDADRVLTKVRFDDLRLVEKPALPPLRFYLVEDDGIIGVQGTMLQSEMCRLGKHQLRLLMTLASPSTRLVIADARSESLERIGLVKAHSPARPATGTTKAIPAGMVGITPAGLRRLADELEAGNLDQFILQPKGTA